MDTKCAIIFQKTFVKGIRKTVTTMTTFQSPEIGMGIKVDYIHCSSFCQCQPFDVSIRIVMSTTDYNRFFSGFMNQSRSEEHTSELQSRPHLVCRLLLEKKNS